MNLLSAGHSYNSSSSASVSGRGWLSVSGSDRVKRPVRTARHPISSIGSPSLYCAYR